MDIYARNDKGFVQFMDLIPKEEEEEETNLELSLGPPGKNFTIKRNNKTSSRKISTSYDFDHVFNNTCFENGALMKPPQRSPEVSKSNPVMMKQPSSQSRDSSGPLDMHSVERKAFSPSVRISSLKRIASGPVVGWPPVRSFRKNVTSSKSETENGGPDEERKLNSTKNKLVKINMDGIPIGRKVDLKTHDSYEKLSDAVDQLFRGFLAAAQSNASGDGNRDREEGDKAIVCLLDGSGEYSLVYEDSEGDKMLVGDVPWNMFVSTVKRLRVLKSSEIPTLSRANSNGKYIS